MEHYHARPPEERHGSASVVQISSSSASRWISPEEIHARAALAAASCSSSSSSAAGEKAAAENIDRNQEELSRGQDVDALPNAGCANNAQPAAPARSCYGREYKRPRPFTPPTASRPKRHNSILALPEVEPDLVQQLDFVDVVDVDSDSELQVAADEMEIAGNAAVQPAQPGRSPGVDEDHDIHAGIGFSRTKLY